MARDDNSHEQPGQEIERLRAELAEAQETLRAIREGQVDALVVSTPEGLGVFTLQGADQAYRTIIEQMQEGAVTLIGDGRISYSNRCFAQMVQQPLEEMIGSHIRDHVAPSDHARLKQLVRQALGGNAHGELNLRISDGNHVPVRVSMNLMVLDGLPSICLMATDITERKQAERVLASEQFVRAILNQAADGIIVYDAQERLVFANPAARRIMQFQEATPVITVSRLWQKVLNSEGCPIPAAEQSLTIALGGQAAMAREQRVVRSDGSYCDILLSASPLRDTDGEILGAVATFSDISERKRAEEAERQQREWLRVTLTSIGDAVIAVDTAARVTFLNPVAAALVGWSQERAIGQPITAVFPIVNEKTDEGIDIVVARVLREKVAIALGSDTMLVTKDGSRVPIEDSAAPILDASGNIVGVVLVFHDVTIKRRIQEELKAAKNAAEQATAAAERANRAKDHFLAVLSHELRTPLTPVVMGVSMLRDRPDLDPEIRAILDMVHRNIAMEAGLIDDLLDVTRIARGKIELHRSPVDVCAIIQRALDVCRSEIETGGLCLGVDLGPNPPYWVEADVARLGQVFWNLLKNAIKFTPRGGRVAIRCRATQTHVSVDVNDSGIGIEAESLPRIFNAFEQTEHAVAGHFGGLGLGLAISKALVELHGGTISAHSQGRDKGATFRVHLPLCVPEGQAEAHCSAPPAKQSLRPLHILLVEDHRVTAEMMRMVLTAEGHTVAAAETIAAALEQAEHHAFDLLLSDLGLPDGSGHDLMRALRSRGHKFPGVALSGYGQEGDIHRSYQAGFAAHLTKPASRDSVIGTVARVAAGKHKASPSDAAAMPSQSPQSG